MLRPSVDGHVRFGEKHDGSNAVWRKGVARNVENSELAALARGDECILNQFRVVQPVWFSNPEFCDYVLTQSIRHSPGDPPSTEGFEHHTRKPHGRYVNGCIQRLEGTSLTSSATAESRIRNSSKLIDLLQTKKPDPLFQEDRALNNIPGGVLLSHKVALAVPSALEGLTSVFGMGTGVTPPLEPPRSSFEYLAARLRSFGATAR